LSMLKSLNSSIDFHIEIRS